MVWSIRRSDRPPLRPEAFCDANVLYPSLLRDLLIRLDIEGTCRLRWSADVNEEWIHALVRDRHLARAPLDETRRRMNLAPPAAQVDGFHHLIPTLQLPDPDDRHVLAAALQSGAPHLITSNLDDFPPSALPSPGPQVVHPDLWLAPMLAQDPQITCQALTRMVAAFRRHPLTVADVPGRLITLRLPQSAQVFYGLVTQGIC